MKAHPTVCGPWDTAALMPQSLSISTDSAYERHGYTLPILARVKGLSTAAGRCVCNKRDLLNGQSSPGTLQVGQHPSKGTRQIPHTSSSGSPFSSVLPVSHCHWAMACHFLTMTFMVWVRDAFVCLCVRDETAALSDRVAFTSRKCAVLPAGCQRCRGKKRRHPRLGRDCWNGEVVCSWVAKVVGMISA
jgi:hypothetical protein